MRFGRKNFFKYFGIKLPPLTLRGFLGGSLVNPKNKLVNPKNMLVNPKNEIHPANSVKVSLLMSGNRVQ